MSKRTLYFEPYALISRKSLSVFYLLFPDLPVKYLSFLDFIK
jgi:hypothetical protein